MIEIPLSQGKFALVDDDEQVQWKWSAYQDKYTFYATRHVLLLHFGEFARLNFEEIHESEQATSE